MRVRMHDSGGASVVHFSITTGAVVGEVVTVGVVVKVVVVRGVVGAVVGMDVTLGVVVLSTMSVSRRSSNVA